MPRIPRVAPAGVIQHVLNRAAPRKQLFQDAEDYRAFIHLLGEGREHVPGVKLLGFCLMPDHWHLIAIPSKAGELSKFVRWVSTTQVRRARLEQKTTTSEFYESRFRNFPIQPGEALLTVLRFIESNPRRAKLVAKSEAWKWSSAAGTPESKKLLSPLPIRRPANWTKLLNTPMDAATLHQLETAVSRNQPFGDPAWVTKTASRLGLQSTLRPHGRPRKSPVASGSKRPMKSAQ